MGSRSKWHTGPTELQRIFNIHLMESRFQPWTFNLLKQKLNFSFANLNLGSYVSPMMDDAPHS